MADDHEEHILPLLSPTKLTDGAGRPLAKRAAFRDFVRVFWPLPLIAFGGPHACVALLYATFVRGRPGGAVPSATLRTTEALVQEPRVSEAHFLELYALSQSLPGPNSTKLVALLGATFGGVRGAVCAAAMWLLPGFAVMSAAGAWFHAHLNDTASALAIQHTARYALGLVAAAFAFVLIAAFRLVSKIVATDPCRAVIANAALALAVLAPPRALPGVCVGALTGGGATHLLAASLRAPPRAAISDVSLDSDEDVEVTCGAAASSTATADARKTAANDACDDLDIPISRREGAFLLAMVVTLTAAIFGAPGGGAALMLTRTFWRIGLCVYGGALVIVPLLITEFVEGGLLPAHVFLAAFGLFGCVPGPMMNLVPFLGAAVFGWSGAVIGLFAINSPGIMLQLGLVPFWASLRKFEGAQTFLQGTNSAAAGLIVAGVWMLLNRALTGPAAFVLTMSAGSMALIFEMPMPAIVLVHGIAGVMLEYFGIGLNRALA